MIDDHADVHGASDFQVDTGLDQALAQASLHELAGLRDDHFFRRYVLPKRETRMVKSP